MSSAAATATALHFVLDWGVIEIGVRVTMVERKGFLRHGRTVIILPLTVPLLGADTAAHTRLITDDTNVTNHCVGCNLGLPKALTPYRPLLSVVLLSVVDGM